MKMLTAFILPLKHVGFLPSHSKKADFSSKAQAASKKTKLTIADKVLVPPVKWATKQVNMVNGKLIEKNKRNK